MLRFSVMDRVAHHISPVEPQPKAGCQVDWRWEQLLVPAGLADESQP